MTIDFNSVNHYLVLMTKQIAGFSLSFDHVFLLYIH